MKRINLIPPGARRLSVQGWIKKHIFKSPVLKLVIFSILILGLIFIHSTFTLVKYRIKISLQKKNLKDLEVELIQSKDEQQKIRDKIDVIEQENKYLKKRLSFLEKAGQEVIKWSEVLLSLSKSAPPDLWMKKICLNRQIITLDGTALNNNLVSDFMIKLDESGYFRATGFNFTQKKRIPMRGLMG